MFPTMRFVLVSIWSSTIAGLVIVLGLSFGLYGWAVFYWANLVGVVIGGPAGLITWAVLCPGRLREVGWFGLGEM